MKIKVEKWITDEYNKSYKIISIDKCCDKLINSKNICIANESDEFETYYDDETDDNYSVKICREEKDYEGWTDYFYESIKYCPHCGEKIEIEIVNTVDKQEELEQLRKERDLLWKKCCKTNSKKKEHELQQQVRELDNKINYIHISDDFIREEE